MTTCPNKNALVLKPLQTGLGLGLSVVAEGAYLAVGQPGGALFLEHSHVGLASIIAGLHWRKYFSLATGFGLGLIIEDAEDGNTFGLQPNPNNPTAAPLAFLLYAAEVGIILYELS